MAYDALLNFGANERLLYESLRRPISQIEKKGINLRFGSSGGQPLGTISKDMSQFQKSLEAAEARVLAFGATASVLYTVIRGIKELVVATVQVEKSLQDINVILGLSTGSLKKFGDDLFKVAQNTGQSFANISKAAVELSRQGLGVEETLKRTRDAAILSRLTNLDLVDSVDAITAGLNSFNAVALDSTTIINKLANVDAQFAVSAADLAEAIKRVGSTSQDVGVGFEELLALITSVKQVTAREGSVIANGLKTIFQRIQRPEVLRQLEEFGIQIRNLNTGELLGTTDILKNLADGYNNLTPALKNQTVQLAAGVYQANVFRALLSDLSRGELSNYSNALKTANENTDAAIIRNEKLNETLSALANRTFVNLTRVGAEIGKGAVEPTLRPTLEFINKTLDSAFSTQEVEGIGTRIAVGIFRGIGNYLTGPAVGLLAATFLKIFSNFTKGVREALMALLQSNSELQKTATLEQQINSELQRKLLLENQILSVQQKQNQIKGQQLQLSNYNQKVASVLGVPYVPSESTIQRRFSAQRGAASTGLKGIANANIGFGGAISAVDANQLAAQLGLDPQKIQKALNKIPFKAGANYATETFRRYQAAFLNVISEAETGALLARTKQLASAQAQIKSKIDQITSRAGYIFAGGKERDLLRQLDPAAYGLINRQRQEKFAGRALGVGLAAPILTGIVGESFGRKGQSVTEGLGNFVGQAATGAMLGSIMFPTGGAIPGAAAGGAIGLFTSLSKIFNEFNTNLPELISGFEKLNEELGKSVEALDQFVNIQLQLQDSSISGKERKNLGIQSVNLFSSLSPEVRRAFLNNGRNIQDPEVQKVIEQEKIKASTAKSLESFANFIGAGKGKDLTTILQTETRGFAATATGAMLPPLQGKTVLSREGVDFARGVANRLLGAQGSGGSSILSFLGQNAPKGQEGPIKFLREGNLSSLFQAAGAPLGQDFIKTFQELPIKIQDLILKEINNYISEDLLNEIYSALQDTGQTENTKELENKLKDLVGKINESLAENIFNSETTGQLISDNITKFQLQNLDFISRESGIRNSAALGRISPVEEATQLKNLQTEQFGQDRQLELIKLLGENIYKPFVKSSEASIKKLQQEIFSNPQYDPRVDRAIDTIRDIQSQLNDIGKQVFEGVLKPEEASAKIETLRQSLENEATGIPKDLTKDTYDALLDIQKNISEVIVQSNDVINQYNIKITEATEKALKQIDYLRATTERLGINNRFSAGNISGRERAEQLSNLGKLESRRPGFTSGQGLRGAGEAFTSQFVQNQTDFFDNLQDSAVDTAQTIKQSFKDSFASFVDGTKSAKEAFSDLMLSISSKLSERVIDIGIDSLFSGLFKGLGAGVNKSSGGVIGKYSSGGLVSGGSGTTDDVMGLLSSGDYVLKKSAVAKYGAEKLAALNSGVNLRLANSFDYNDESYPTGGTKNTSSFLTGFALEDENNPQNTLRNEREQNLINYLSEKAAYDQQKAEAMKQYKKQKSQALYGAYISGAIGGVGGYFMSRSASRGPSFYKSGFNFSNSTPKSPISDPYNPSLQFARGGSVFGGDYSTDTIPAMLTGGEFVIRKPVVDRMGTAFFDKLNRGELPKFASGGLVGVNANETNYSDINNTLLKLVSVNEEISKNIKGSQSRITPSPTDPGVVNNVSINISVDKSGNAETTTKTNSSEEEGKKMKQLAESMKALVLQTLVEQKRPGGLIKNNS